MEAHELLISRTCLLVEQPCPTDHAAQQILLLHGLSLASQHHPCCCCCSCWLHRWEERRLPDHNWTKFLEAKRKELQRLNGAYKNTLKNANVELMEGFGKIVDPHTVEVDGKKLTVCRTLLQMPHLKGSRLPDSGPMTLLMIWYTSSVVPSFFLDDKIARAMTECDRIVMT